MPFSVQWKNNYHVSANWKCSVLLKYVFYYCTLLSNYCNFLSICQNSIILVWLQRFQKVEQFCKIKSKSERRRFGNEKEKHEKIQLLFKQPKILHFYWNENLKLLWCQLSKKFWKISFGFEVMGSSLEVIFAKKHRFLLFFALVWPKNFSYNCWSKKDFWKMFWWLILPKIQVFASVKMQHFTFSSSSFLFLSLLFSDLNFTPWNLSNSTKIVEFWQIIKSYSSLEKVCNDKKIVT